MIAVYIYEPGGTVVDMLETPPMNYESRVVVRGGIVVDKPFFENHVDVRGGKVVDRPSFESHVGVRGGRTLCSCRRRQIYFTVKR